MNEDKGLLRHRRKCIPWHFIHELKTIHYNVIDLKENLLNLLYQLKIELKEPVKPVISHLFYLILFVR